jgi:hypothetical protein
MRRFAPILLTSYAPIRRCFSLQASTALKEQRSDYHGGRGCSMNSESCALPTSVCQDDEGVAERYE